MANDPGRRPVDPERAKELRRLPSWNEACTGEMSIESPCSNAQGWKKPRNVPELGVDGMAVRGRPAASRLAAAKLLNERGEGSAWSSYEAYCHVLGMGGG